MLQASSINIRGVAYAASQLKHRLSRMLLQRSLQGERRYGIAEARDAFDLINRRVSADDETARVFCENANKLIAWGIITEPELITLIDSSAGVGW